MENIKYIDKEIRTECRKTQTNYLKVMKNVKRDPWYCTICSMAIGHEFRRWDHRFDPVHKKLKQMKEEEKQKKKIHSRYQR